MGTNYQFDGAFSRPCHHFDMAMEGSKRAQRPLPERAQQAFLFLMA
jgi:hypothetical protein